MLKIKYFYDILCPYSWLGYQIIRQKLPIWKTLENFEIQYIPAPSPFIVSKAIDYQSGDMCLAERQYRIKNLKDIADHYGFEQGNFERLGDETIRTRSTLSFLNVLRNEHPRLHMLFMDKLWTRVFIENKAAASTNDFLKVARQNDIQFTQITDIIMKIENRENVLNLSAEINPLMDERVVGFPWIKVDVNGHKMSFCEILRLELIDEIARDPLVIPHSDKYDRISAL